MFTGPRRLELRQSVIAGPKKDQVLVRTLYSGISAGTEMNVFRGIAPQWRTHRDPATGLFIETGTPEWSYPLTYGYATVGRVESVGSSVPSDAHVSVGDHVFTYTPHSSVSVVSWDKLVPLPALADLRVGVLLANLNTALNGILDARPCLGDVVVVSGLGVIGLIIVQLLRRSGVGSIIAVDPLEQRREISKRFGADTALDPGESSVAEAVRELTENRGADIVLEVSGSPRALGEAIRTVGYNGRVVVLSWYGDDLGLLNLGGEFHHNRPRVISSQVGGINPDLGPLWSVQRRQKLATSLLGDLELEALVTHEFAVEEAWKAYALIDEGNPDVVQCVLTYGQAP